MSLTPARRTHGYCLAFLRKNQPQECEITEGLGEQSRREGKCGPGWIVVRVGSLSPGSNDEEEKK
jgi:hypothetical protein